MGKFKLTPIDVVTDISKADFDRLYLKPRKPVVIKAGAKDWPAYNKWNFDYLKSMVGESIVPVYDSKKADPNKPINATTAEMSFNDYADLIQAAPTDLRIFFWDPMKVNPGLLEDYRAPKNLMGGFLDKYPSMFFGGAGSVTFLHYDIDLAHIFHTHFCGRKHVMLFEYKYKTNLYCLPFATYALEDYDVENPDFDKYPALREVEGIEAFLEHGDVLFMPTGWWHWMKYLDPSFSISLRAWDKSWAIKARSLYNLTIQRKFDDFMKTNFGPKYMQWKEEKALEKGRELVARKHLLV